MTIARRNLSHPANVWKAIIQMKATFMKNSSFPTLWALIALMFSQLACNTLFPPKPKIEWHTDPEALVVRASFGGGLVPQNFALNALPDAQVWGDGHIIWVEYDTQGARRVLEGYLTAAQVETYLREVVNAGFFGWENVYSNPNVYDAGTQCLRIYLTSESKSVCEYYEGAPRAFHQLYNTVAAGAGADGADYVPAQGYLTALAIGDVYSQPVALHWPADSLGLSLGETLGGVWVEGEALELAWRTLNTNLYAIVQEGDAYYQLIVQVPGVSQSEPPAP